MTMVCAFLFLVTMASIVTRMSRAESECGGRFTRRKGLISLPQKMSDSIVCSWTITVPEGHVVNLFIKRYIHDNKSDPKSLGHHDFRVYDVLHSRQKILIQTMSGHDIPYFGTFSNSAVVIEYTSFDMSSSNNKLFYFNWMVDVVPSIRDCPSGIDVKDGYIKEGTTATCKCYHPVTKGCDSFPMWLSATGIRVQGQYQHQNQETTYLPLRYNPNVNKTWTLIPAYAKIPFTPKFAYGPHEATLVIHLDPKEKFCNSTSTFTVDCEVLFNDTNPAPLISLEGTGVTSISLVQDYNTSHSYRYKFTVSYEAPAFVTLKCVAMNSVFPGLSATKLVSISSVSAGQTISPPIMTVENGPSLRKDGNHTVDSGQTIHITCRRDGGYLPTSKVNITCGRHQTMSSGMEATLILEIDKEMNQRKCICTADYGTKSCTKTTEFTLYVKYASTVTNYTANSLTQILEVMDGDHVTFSCESEGYPMPDLFIKGQRSQRFNLRHFISGENKLTGDITTVMRCNDTDTYTCTAGNGVGGLVSKSLSVFVKCTPQLQFYKENEIIKEFTTFNSDLKIEIHIKAYPIPFNYTMTKVRNISSLNREIDLMRVELSESTDYNVTFTVRELPLGTVVVWMLDLIEEDIGQYIINIGNGIGDGLDYRFNVNVVPESDHNNEDMERNDLNVEFIVGISVACCLCVVMFLLGMKIGKTRNKASKDVIMLQPSPDYEDTSGFILEEAYVDVDFNHVQNSRLSLQSQCFHHYEILEPLRHDDSNRSSDGCVAEMFKPLWNPLDQNTGEVAMCPIPDFQDTNVPQLFGMNLGSNKRERQHESETIDPFSSNERNVEYLDVLDKSGETIPLKPLDNNESSVSPLVGSSPDVDSDLFQVYETTEDISANCNFDKHYTGFLEADGEISNTNPDDSILSESSADHQDKRVNPPQESNRGNDQSPRACQQEQTMRKIPDYEEPNLQQTISNNGENDFDYVEADDDCITVLSESQVSD